MNSIVHSPWMGFAQVVLGLVGTWLLAFGLKSVRQARGFDTADPAPRAWRFWAGLVVLTAAALPSLVAPLVVEATPPRQTIGPSVAEVFALRSKCAELGEKILAGNSVGNALTQSQVSRYDPIANRCYVELDTHMADLDRFDEYNARTVFDGQTAELLARIQNQKGKQTAFLKGGPHDYEAALQRVEALMSDDRK